MTPVRFAVVDDDAAAARQLAGYVRLFCRERGFEGETCVFTDGERFLQEAAGRADIVFFDIEMPAPDGLAAAAALRERDQEAVIIFVTSYEQYAIRGYTVNAYRYLVKPVAYTALCEALEKPVARVVDRCRRFLNARSEGGLVRIPLDSIVFIETIQSHRTLLHAKDGDCLLSMSLRELEAALDPASFARCHTSFIVNLR